MNIIPEYSLLKSEEKIFHYVSTQVEKEFWIIMIDLCSGLNKDGSHGLIDLNV